MTTIIKNYYVPVQISKYIYIASHMLHLVYDHHMMHLLVGFIGDPTGQLNTSANSGELTTARALQVI